MRGLIIGALFGLGSAMAGLSAEAGLPATLVCIDESEPPMPEAAQAMCAAMKMELTAAYPGIAFDNVAEAGEARHNFALFFSQTGGQLMTGQLRWGDSSDLTPDRMTAGPKLGSRIADAAFDEQSYRRFARDLIRQSKIPL